jgi:hypothetical protein
LLDEMPTSGLPEALPALLTADRPKTLGACCVSCVDELT